MSLTEDDLTPEARAALDEAYEAWLAKVRASDGEAPHGEPDAFSAGFNAGRVQVVEALKRN